MKEKEHYLIFPKKKPKTLKDLMEWQEGLFEECLDMELKKTIWELSIKNINAMIQDTTPYLKKDLHKEGAMIKLKKLQKIKAETQEELRVIKKFCKSYHQTNEMIIGSIMSSHIGKDKTIELRNRQRGTFPNLLHGDGWMFEYATFQDQKKKGKAPFLTFGTFMDPCKADVIILEDPNIKIDIDYSKIKKSLKK